MFFRKHRSHKEKKRKKKHKKKSKKNKDKTLSGSEDSDSIFGPKPVKCDRVHINNGHSSNSFSFKKNDVPYGPQPPNATTDVQDGDDSQQYSSHTKNNRKRQRVQSSDSEADSDCDSKQRKVKRKKPKKHKQRTK